MWQCRNHLVKTSHQRRFQRNEIEQTYGPALSVTNRIVVLSLVLGPVLTTSRITGLSQLYVGLPALRTTQKLCYFVEKLADHLDKSKNSKCETHAVQVEGVGCSRCATGNRDFDDRVGRKGVDRAGGEQVCGGVRTA
jgi:hypothetical protein